MHVTCENTDCAILSFFVHNVCNFSCSYCWDVSHASDQLWPADTTPYLKLVEQIKKANKYVYIEVLGGEPTYWPQFPQFIKDLSDENVLVEFGTNGSRPLKYWERFEARQQFICMSWHYKEINDDHFYKVAEILQHKTSLHIALMMLPENFKRGQKMYERLQDLQVSISPKFVRDKKTNRLLEYSEEQRQWILKNRFDQMKPLEVQWDFPQTIYFNSKPIHFSKVLDQGLNQFRGWTCKAGIKRLWVDPNGDLKKCAQGVDGVIGNIFSGDYRLPEEETICSSQYCPCKLDALVEKRSPDHPAL